MRIKKILIVPIELIVEDKPDPYSAAFFVGGLKYIKRKMGMAPSVYNGELQFYADLPVVLGRENVFLFGKYYPHFHLRDIPPMCAYPSCHGTPRPLSLSEAEVHSQIREMDAVLVSTLAGRRGELVIKLAKKFDISVALIDFKDHFDIFGSTAPVLPYQLYRGFVRGTHFDLFFKKDLPLGYANEYTFPIAPVPIRPESYNFRVLPKDTDIFYSGAKRVKGVGDRFEVTQLVKDSFVNAVILEKRRGDAFLSTQSYLDHLSRARIALSPSGFVWDSFRHCEVGLAPKTVLLAPRPYMEVVGPFLEDGVNAILYETEFSDGRYHLINRQELIA
ncbi:MAG: hypothetical protein WAP51_01295, partial [Candidatus Sungiibacteriota bacterium]